MLKFLVITALISALGIHFIESKVLASTNLAPAPAAKLFQVQVSNMRQDSFSGELIFNAEVYNLGKTGVSKLVLNCELTPSVKEPRAPVKEALVAWVPALKSFLGYKASTEVERWFGAGSPTLVKRVVLGSGLPPASSVACEAYAPALEGQT